VSSGIVPEVNTLIELAVLGGGAYRSRVDDRDGSRLTVAAPLNLLVSDLPAIGLRLTVRWPAGRRGRYAAPARVVGFHHDQVATWDIELTGPAEIEQNRQYVRGGGGEPIRLRRTLSPDDPPADSWVVDLSERSVRGRFAKGTFRPGDPVAVRIVLEEDVIEVEGSVLRLIEHPEPQEVDVVVLYEPDESQATTIRRYVLRQQMLTRARTAGA
jgi:hypothetical protein